MPEQTNFFPAFQSHLLHHIVAIFLSYLCIYFMSSLETINRPDLDEIIRAKLHFCVVLSRLVTYVTCHLSFPLPVIMSGNLEARAGFTAGQWVVTGELKINTWQGSRPFTALTSFSAKSLRHKTLTFGPGMPSPIGPLSPWTPCDPWGPWKKTKSQKDNIT